MLLFPHRPHHEIQRGAGADSADLSHIGMRSEIHGHGEAQPACNPPRRPRPNPRAEGQDTAIRVRGYYESIHINSPRSHHHAHGADKRVAQRARTQSSAAGPRSDCSGCHQ